MAKLSQLDKAIASTQDDIGLLELVLAKLIAQKTQPTKKATSGRKVRKLGSVLDEPAS